MAALVGTTAVVGGEPYLVLEVDEDTGFAMIYRENDEGEGSSEFVPVSELCYVGAMPGAPLNSEEQAGKENVQPR